MKSVSVELLFRNKIWTILGVVVLLLFSSSVYSQTKSNKGKEFWLGYMSHEEGTDADMSLYITSDSNTTGTVSIPGQSWSTTFSVTANSLTVVSIPSNLAYISCSDCISAKGIKVTSVDDIIVYSHHYMDNQSDATLVLPTRTQGKEYYAMAYEQSSQSNSGRSEFIIVAHKDDTKINITPATDLAGSSGTKSSGTTYQITLDEGEVYQGKGLSGTSSYDITGTHIEVIDTGNTANCRTVAVFSGSSYTRIGGCNSGWGINSGDNLYEQMFPVNSWGKDFALIPALGRTSDNFKILAGTDNTTVALYTSTGVTSLTLNEGETFDYNDRSTPARVRATQPVMVAQFQKTAKCDGNNNRTGDPSMTILNPLEQTLTDITLYSSADYDIDNHYINVIMPSYARSSFTLDGSAVTGWANMPLLTDHSYVRLTVNSGNHRLTADVGFVAFAYGEGRYESYGYAAGANVRDLTATIEVSNSPKTTELSNCLGLPTKFKGNAEYTVTQWAWDFGDDSTSSMQNPEHIYADTGVYEVRLYTYKAVFDGCSVYDSTFVTVHVYERPTAIFVAENLCDSMTARFYDSSSIPSQETYNFTKWNIDGGADVYGKTPTKIFDTTGKYEVQMIVGTVNQCKDTITDSVTVSPNPIVDFLSPNSCFVDSASFTNQTTIATGTIDENRWEISDGQGSMLKDPNIMFADSGKYYVTLVAISDSGCSGEYTDSMYNHPEFNVSFTYNDTCFGNGNTFMNTSSIVGGSFTDTTWYTSEVDTFNTFNLSKEFQTATTHTIELIMEQDSFCYDTFSQFIDIHPLPIADFSVTGFCQNDTTEFIDLSTLSAGTYSASWDLDDGLTATGTPVRMKYASNADKDVTLTITTDEGCTDDTTRQLSITNPEIISFDINDICFNETLTVGANMSLGLDSFTSFLWSVNNTESYIDSSFDYTPTTTGVKVLTLDVGTRNGCAISYTDSFRVHEIPTSAFTVADICVNEDLVPINTSTAVAPSTIDSYLWRIDGTNSSTNQDPTINQTTIGNKTIELVAISDLGCRDSLSNTVNVFELPVVDFTTLDQCFNQATLLSDASTIGLGSISSYDWTIDGVSRSGSMVNYTFPSVSTYLVKEVVTSNNNCKDSLSKNVDIYPLPVVDFSSTDLEGCEPYNTSFANNSNIPSGSISSYLWRWGDGNESTGDNPGFTYQNYGTYQVTLIATSDQGCIDSIDMASTILVHPRPTADFNFDPTDPNSLTTTVIFGDLSTTDVTTWDWYVQDGTQYGGQTASHIFEDSGYVAVELRVENDNGCRDSITKSVYVNANIFVYIPDAFTPDGDLLNDEFGLAGLTQGVKGVEFMIYNRWGEKVFESYDANEKWDGTYKGEPAQQGVYIYRVKYTNLAQTKWFYLNGNIHLLRK